MSLAWLPFSNTVVSEAPLVASLGSEEPVKRHRGEPGHTGDTRAHTGTWITQTNLTTIQTHQHTRTTRDDRIRGRLNGRSAQPAAQVPRSRTLPAADSEEAAPSESDPAASRSQSASPRLLEGGRRNESARSRRVAAGGAAGAPDDSSRRERRRRACATAAEKPT